MILCKRKGLHNKFQFVCWLLSGCCSPTSIFLQFVNYCPITKFYQRTIYHTELRRFQSSHFEFCVSKFDWNSRPLYKIIKDGNLTGTIWFVPQFSLFLKAHILQFQLLTFKSIDECRRTRLFPFRNQRQADERKWSHNNRHTRDRIHFFAAS